MLRALSTPPQLTPPTIPVIRCAAQLRAAIISTQPLFLASHWLRDHSVPCFANIAEPCPFCESASPRAHAYLAILAARNIASVEIERSVLELPARPAIAALQDALALDNCFARGIECHRSSKHASPSIAVTPTTLPTIKDGVRVKPTEIIRALAKLYDLPDPIRYESLEAWGLAAKLRATQPNYDPRRRIERKE
jgi:hypothetical protein